MIQRGEQEDRHVIPRWNGIDTAVKAGELNPVSVKSKEKIIHSNNLDYLLYEWKSEKSLPLAIEIVTADDSSDNYNSVEQREYIKEIIRNNYYLPKSVSELLEPSRNCAVLVKEGDYYEEIKIIKEKLIGFPRNPLLWCELARNYLILGQENKSEKALKIAYNLSPENRLILRALSRYCLQMNKPDEALFILRKTPGLIKDPWLLSTEIAITNSISKTSRYIKTAQGMVDSANYSPLSISELASELGTMDFISGQSKRGKRKFKQAIVHPVENAVAQIAWSHNHVHGVGEIVNNIPNTIENDYESKVELGKFSLDWVDTVKLAEEWLKYQPFASEPAVLCSFYYIEYEGDNERARRVLLPSMRSNPENIDVINNYVYSFLLEDNIDKAESELKKANKMTGTELNIPLVATNGMFLYRSGDFDNGRVLYQKAITMAKQKNNYELAFKALICLAREEKRIGNDIGVIMKEICDNKNKRYYDMYKTMIEKYDLPLS